MAAAVRRGYVKEDEKWFADDVIPKLHTAQEEVQWLLDRGYKMKKVLELVGNHYQLSVRQRAALMRSTGTQKQYEQRKRTCLEDFEAGGEGINIDGFNLIITLEVALSGSTLIMGSDGVIRDLAGLRGVYRLIDKTDKALNLIGEVIHELKVPSIKIFLDEPVSNSGRLKGKILEFSGHWGIPVEVELVRNPDTVLSSMGRVVTSDSVILDQCTSWLNLSRKIITQYIPYAKVVPLKSGV